MGKVVKLGTEKQIKYATEEIIQTKYFCSHCPDCYYWDNCGSMEDEAECDNCFRRNGDIMN